MFNVHHESYYTRNTRMLWKRHKYDTPNFHVRSNALKQILLLHNIRRIIWSVLVLTYIHGGKKNHVSSYIVRCKYNKLCKFLKTSLNTTFDVVLFVPPTLVRINNVKPSMLLTLDSVIYNFPYVYIDFEDISKRRLALTFLDSHWNYKCHILSHKNENEKFK